eukprot:GILK01009315.1.p1 GENE.GILK01009315.1~~GILK01009315.1.p1  ORF type:complete len:212 (-),score=37.39 GILK01009315.1:128-763(-)
MPPKPPSSASSSSSSSWSSSASRMTAPLPRLMGPPVLSFADFEKQVKNSIKQEPDPDAQPQRESTVSAAYADHNGSKSAGFNGSGHRNGTGNVNGVEASNKRKLEDLPSWYSGQLDDRMHMDLLDKMKSIDCGYVEKLQCVVRSMLVDWKRSKGHEPSIQDLASAALKDAQRQVPNDVKAYALSCLSSAMEAASTSPKRTKRSRTSNESTR